MHTHHRLELCVTLVSLLAATNLTGCGAANESGSIPGRDSAEESAGSTEPSARGSSCVLPSGRRTFDQSKSAEARAEVQDCVPAYTAEEVKSAFVKIRDTRGLSASGQPDFPRRISWQLPDNGCEERAQQAAFWLEEWGYPRPYFARANKDLGLDTVNDVSGHVTWGQHVAVLVRVEEELLVLDPAVDSAGPLRLSDWVARITIPGGSSELALCHEYGLKDDCFAAEPGPLTASDIDTFLNAEWLNEKMLGRDPTQTLGSCPTWLGCAPPDPVGDPTLPPIIEQFTRTEYDDQLSELDPRYVIGNNFIPGVTTLHISGNGIDRLATLDGTLLRRTILTDELPIGEYEVFATNGEHVSAPAKMKIVW